MHWLPRTALAVTGAGYLAAAQEPQTVLSVTVQRPELPFLEQARDILSRHPLIDGHVDTPYVIRHLGERPLDVLPEVATGLAGHVDFPRLRAGGVGGLFHVAYAPCDEEPTGPDFLQPTNSVEWALESVDLVHRMVELYPDELALATTAQEVRDAFAAGKIASLLALEGSHHLMNSLAVLRLFAQLGVRYLTLTHTCHTSFASSAGDGSPIEPVHDGNGLTSFGRELVPELNRLGMMVDLSHVSDQTMRDAISLSKAPVIFSHSGARAICDHPRNVPDDVLDLIGPGDDQNNGIVMIVFYPSFIDLHNATHYRVADHVDYVAARCGKKHVGLGSDFDGMRESVAGLEDASKFPNLIAELLRRGWTEPELADLVGGNLLRVMEAVEGVKASLAGERASPAVYEKRFGHDLPVVWGGPAGQYLPQDVADEVGERFGHHQAQKDEL
ncbi:dipeptidase [Rhodotorula sp. JG-1b]|nr:dipeptidase [Rhodotorula sp. JG-1b]